MYKIKTHKGATRNIAIPIVPYEADDTTLCDKVCQWLASGWWFSQGIPVSSTNKTDCHDITEILLKVALNIITPPHPLLWSWNVERV